MTQKYVYIKKSWPKILVSLLLIVCLAGISATFLLKKGIKLDSFSVGGVQLLSTSLIWQKRLKLQVDTVTVSRQYEESTSSKHFERISQNFKFIHFLPSLFSTVTIREFRIGELTGSINFNRDEDRKAGTFTLDSNDLTIRSKLSFDQEVIVVDITEAISTSFRSQAEGQVRFDTDQEQLTGTLSANPGGSLPIIFNFKADRNQISFQGKEAGRIDTINPLVDLFGLEENIERWITKYLTGTRYHLDSFHGTFLWNDPRTVLDTLYAEVRVEDCEYTFAPGLEPVKTSDTNVIFSKGILTITPQNSTFYGHSGETSWLDIDFNDPANIILTAHIKTNARIDDDIRTLLNYYNINLPFKQTEGKTKTDLTLTINLNKQQVETSGSFQIAKGSVEWDHKKYGVTNAKLTLNDSSINIEEIVVTYDRQFIAEITGTLDTRSGVGDLAISVQKFTFKAGESTLTLNEAGPKPKIDYHIRPNGHSLDGSSSSWKLDTLHLEFGPFSSPFSVNTLSGTLPPTLLTMPPGISVELSGSFSIKDQKADFLCNVIHYKHKDLVLESSSLPVTVQYAQGLNMKTDKTSHWTLNNIPSISYPTEAKFSNNVLSVINSRIRYGDFFDSHVSGQYNTLHKLGTFLLSDLQIKDKNIGHLWESDKGLPIEVNGEQDKFIIKVPELDLSISSSKNNNWAATFNDLSTLHKRSTLLQQYSVDAGSLTIASEDGNKPYNFSANIPYHYPILVRDNKPLDQLSISGKITDHGVSATVNDELQVHYTDHLSVTSENLGYNVPEIINFLEERPKLISNSSPERQKTTVSFDAVNSSLFFRPHTQALADRIHLEYDGDKNIVRLEHAQGSMIMEIEGDQFALEGKDFNDVFMEALIEKANFKDGKMAMAVKGSFDQSSALIKIENTTLQSLRPLNNMLAFLNTVPALITFSYPEYSTKGLPVTSAVVGMVIREGLVTFEAFDVKSPVFTMTGTGWINIPQNQIDMHFNVVTQAKENINKIPLFGHILTGKKKRPSITLKVQGNLQNPSVENSVFREVATMPLSVLYRTLTLPYHMVETMIDKTEDNQDKKNSDTPNSSKEKKPKS